MVKTLDTRKHQAKVLARCESWLTSGNFQAA
jgi:hypothetical protein